MLITLNKLYKIIFKGFSQSLFALLLLSSSPFLLAQTDNVRVSERKPSKTKAQTESDSSKPEIIVQTGYVPPIVSAGFSPDGKSLASIDANNSLKLWDVQTGGQLRDFMDSTTFAFSSDGKKLASIVSGDSIVIWDIVTGRKIQTLTSTEPLVTRLNDENSDYGKPAVVFSNDGQKLASKNLYGFTIWSLKTGKILKTWNPAQVSKESSLYLQTIDAIVFSPDSNQFISFSDDKARETVSDFKGFDEDSDLNKEKSTNETKQPKVLNGHLIFWDLGSGKEKKSFPLKVTGIVTAAAFSADVETLAFSDVTFYENPETRSIRLCDLKTGQVKDVGLKFASKIQSIVFLPNRKVFAVTEEKNSNIKFWDSVNDKKLIDFPLLNTGQINSIAFSSDGKTLVTATKDKVTRFWDYPSRKEIKRLKIHDDRIASLDSSPDGQRFVLGSVSQIVENPENTFGGGDAPENFVQLLEAITRHLRTETKFWNPENNDQLKPLEGVTGVAISPNGKLMASNDEEGKIQLWDLQKMNKTGTPLDSYFLVTFFSPDSRKIASGSLNDQGDWKIDIFDVTNGVKINTFDDYHVSAIAFSPDSNLIAYKSENALEIRDILTGKRVKSFELNGSDNYVAFIAFSPDGKKIVYGGMNKIELRDVQSGKLIKSFADSSQKTEDELVKIAPDICNSTCAFCGTVFPCSEAKYFGNYKAMLENGIIGFYDIKTQKAVASMLTLERDDWTVISPEGFFEGTPNAQKQILWRLNGNTFDVVPVESFFYEYYYPGLLKAVLGGATPKLPADVKKIVEKDIRQADVRLCQKCPCSKDDLSSLIELEITETESDLCVDILSSPNFMPTDFVDFNSFASRLVKGRNIFAAKVFDSFISSNQKSVRNYVQSLIKNPNQKPNDRLLQMVQREINALLRQEDFFDKFSRYLNPSVEILSLSSKNPKGIEREWLNRRLLEKAFPEIRRGKISTRRSLDSKSSISSAGNETVQKGACPPHEMCLQDMRLFWNERMIKRWRGDVLSEDCQKVTDYRIQCAVKVPVVGTTENKYKAYLFNQDKVKSKDGEVIYILKSAVPDKN